MHAIRKSVVISGALFVALAAATARAENPMDATVLLPQRLMTAEELLREAASQAGLRYAYPTGALVRQIDVSPLNGQAKLGDLLARLAPSVRQVGETVLLEAPLADDTLKPLADALAGGDVDARRVAAYQLGNSRSTRAILPLMAALDDKDASVRHHALRSLDRLERDYIDYHPAGRVSIFALLPEAPADKLGAALSAAPDATSPQWTWSAGLIGRFARPHIPEKLAAQVNHGYGPTARVARWALDRLTAPADKLTPARPTLPRPADLIAAASSAGSPQAKADVLLQLGRLGGPDAWKALLAATDDADVTVRHAAIRALARCPAPEAADKLIAIVTGPQEVDGDDRNVAAMSLGMIASPHVVARLTDYVMATDKPISTVALALSWCAAADKAGPEKALVECVNKKDTDEHGNTHAMLRSYAYVGLARVGTPAACTAIARRYNEYDNTARYVGHSAVRLSGAWNQSAVDHYVGLIKQGKSRIAPHGLEMAEDPRAVDALIEAIDKSTSTGERFHFALQALGRIGDPKAVATLVKLLDHKQQWVAYEALRALRWRFYWNEPAVQAAVKAHPTFKVFAEPAVSLADQPANTWVLRHWPIDFDDYRAVNTSYEAGMTFDGSTGKLVKVNAHGQRCDTPQLGETWLYDPAENTWAESKSPTLPFGMCGTWNLAYEPQSQRTVFLEADGANHGWQWDRARALRPSAPWIYDGKADRWTAVNPLHRQIGGGLRAFGPLVALDDGRVFIHGSAWGGHVPKEIAHRSWTYQPYTNQWTLLPESADPQPGNRSHAAMCYLPDQQRVLLAPSGKDKITWLYDLKTNQWIDAKPAGNPPVMRLPAVFDPVSRTALVFVAEGDGTHIWQYDPKANAWSKLDSPVDVSPHHDSVDVAYDPTHNLFVMDGGHVNWSTDHIAVREVWTYRHQVGQPARPADPARPDLPALPEQVVASVLPDATVEVTWLPVAGAVGYDLYATAVTPGDRMHPKSVFDKAGEFVKLNDKPLAGTTFIDTRKLAKAAGLFSHELRGYHVRAIDAAGRASGPSATVLTLTSSVPRVEAVEQPDGSTLIRWQASPERGIRGYAIYRMDEFRPNLAVRLNPTPVAGGQYVDWCESPRAERRRYYVVAVDALGQEGIPSTGAWAFGRP